MTASAAAILGVYGWLGGDAFTGFPATSWAAMVGAATITQIGGVMGIIWALRFLPATIASVALLAQPVGAATLAWLLLGEALVGEHERLRARVSQFFDRFETQLKQILREGEQMTDLGFRASVAAVSNLLMAVVEGRMGQFSRSGFERSPLEAWDQQWRALQAGLFTGVTL